MPHAATDKYLSNKKRILVIDDDLDICAHIKNTLESQELGYSVEIAANINQADILARRFRPDITLLDIKNDNEKALSLIPYLKSYNPDMDCVVLASQPQLNHLRQQNGEQVADYLFKPLENFKLLNTLELLLSRQALKKEKEATQDKYETLFNQSDDIIFYLSREGFILDANNAALSFINTEKQQVIGNPLWNSPWSEQNPDLSRKLQDVFQQSDPPEQIFEASLNDSICAKKLFHFTLKKIPHKQLSVHEYLLEGQDVTEQQLAEQKIRQLSYIDHLTGLCNHAWFYQTVVRALTNAARHKRCCAIISINVDNFSAFNETHGAHAGDEMLVEIARRLGSCIRQGDIASRRSGDSFSLFLDEISDEDDAGVVAYRVVKTLSYYSPLDHEHPPVTASVGVAIFPQDGNDARTLITSADKTMAKVKQTGKNSFQFCD